MKKQIEIDILVRSSKWQKHAKIEDFITKTTQKLIKNTKINDFLQNSKNQIELSISLVSNAQIKKINNDFRGKNKPTDVLSFPTFDEKLVQKNGFFKNLKTPQIFLGDIVLALEIIELEALRNNKTFKNHLTHLLLHSILHLIGFDHEKSLNDAKKMEKVEIEILEKLKIKNPYKC